MERYRTHSLSPNSQSVKYSEKNFSANKYISERLVIPRPQIISTVGLKLKMYFFAFYLKIKVPTIL